MRVGPQCLLCDSWRPTYVKHFVKNTDYICTRILLTAISALLPKFYEFYIVIGSVIIILTTYANKNAFSVKISSNIHTKGWYADQTFTIITEINFTAAIMDFCGSRKFRIYNFIAEMHFLTQTTPYMNVLLQKWDKFARFHDSHWPPKMTPKIPPTLFRGT